ncbi:MAG: hypothetical protein ACRD0J_14800 [Acidimicrobiales bacterium]
MSRAGRWGLARAGYGAVLVLAPSRVARLYSGRPPDGVATAIVRVLGVRQVVQGLLSVGDPGPAVLALGAEVDVAHAASMVALAAADPDRRRGSLVDAAAAGTMAVITAALARRAGAATALHPVGSGTLPALAELRETVASRLAGVLLPGPLRVLLTGKSPA